MSTTTYMFKRRNKKNIITVWLGKKNKKTFPGGMVM